MVAQFGQLFFFFSVFVEMIIFICLSLFQPETWEVCGDGAVDICCPWALSQAGVISAVTALPQADFLPAVQAIPGL